MTTSPVVTITDELVAELEKEAWLCDSDTSMFMDTAVVAALLAERAELKRNDERLQFVISEGITISSMNGTGRPMVYQCQWHDCRQIDWYKSPTEAIDAAMQAAQ